MPADQQTGEIMTFGLVVHGGAGDIEPHEHAERVAACRSAVEAALEPLRQGASAIDAVEIAVRVLESHPLLNAGYGGALNRDGVVELDALLMDGRTQRFGAVAAVQQIEHPVSLARAILEHCEHHFLVGAGAERFAVEQGFGLVAPESLISPRRAAKVARETAQHDTVGAVALDHAGNVAVAVSTGGLDGKLPGRVGDSPVAGAGGYADNTLGAACATGIGEGIMRALLTFRAVQALESAESAQAAAEQAMSIFTHRFGGVGGLIMLDKQGGIGIAHNTKYLPVAFVAGDRIVARLSGQGADA
jgi:beta-aspartyl-peptidase (threonine type)